MDYTQVKDLINTIDHSTITDFEIKIDNAYIKMNKSSTSITNPNIEITKNNTTNDIDLNNIITSQTIESTKPMTIIPEETKEIKEGTIIVSPIVGTFYNSPSPEKPLYVKVGDKVKNGDVLCIVEAMKIMNEITSNTDGELVEILIENEQMVEFNQPLFRIV